MKNETVNGAMVVARVLQQLGVEMVFAYPGSSFLPIHHAISMTSIRVVTPRHEQAGGFAAGGYSRATGKPGVCLVTCGPGATNLITAMADCFLDHIPVLFISGQIHRQMVGKNSFQDIDAVGITQPITKQSYHVQDINDLAPTLIEAYKTATTGCPGPVFVDIPIDVQGEETVLSLPTETIAEPIPTPQPQEIARIREALLQADCPCILAGGGVCMSGAGDLLRQFAQLYHIPVAASIVNQGVMDVVDPLFLRFPGMNGTSQANQTIAHCDLLLALGTRFADKAVVNVKSYAPKAYIIHVDIDPEQINKIVPANMGVVADVKQVLQALLAQPLGKDYTPWANRINHWRKPCDYPYTPAGTEDIPNVRYVIDTLYRMTHGDAIVVPGAGHFTIFTAQYYPCKRERQVLFPGGFGSMGYGLPTAMGAQLACPNRLVLNIDGDGSFQMNIQELATLVAERIPVKMVIINNSCLGLMFQIENVRFAGCHFSSCYNHEITGSYPDFVKIAAGYGISGCTVAKTADLEPAIQQMLHTEGPFLLDCITQLEEVPTFLC